MEKVSDMDRAAIEMQTILKLIPNDLYEKVPKYILEAIYSCKNDNYVFEYDYDKSLNEQKLTRSTINFIAYLDYNYWADEDTKKELIETWKQNDKIKKEKYSYENLFSSNQENNVEHNELVVVKEKNIFQKIIGMIKGLFM